jgi:selenide,water dikinase
LKGIPTHGDPALLVGYDKSDDACVYQVSDDLCLVQTVDFFPPVVDDPYTFGQIAAANALSDVYAMGAVPKTCLNVMAIPRNLPEDVIRDILRGGYDKVYEAGAVIAGGHTILDEEPKYGLSVTGFAHPDRFYRNCGALAGDALILTKPIGTGIMTTAAKAGLLTNEDMKPAVETMTRLNRTAAEALADCEVHACTDVTGFGLMGHLYEMVSGSNAAARLDVSAIDLMPKALEFARLGVLPEGMHRNRRYCEAFVDPGDTELAICDMLFDPQTSGGLLAAVAEKDAQRCIEAMRQRGVDARLIGRIEEKKEEKIIYLR